MRRTSLILTVLGFGAEIGETDTDQAAPAATAPEEIIVIGRIGELRHQVRIAEEAVYDRFNEINSDDDFDIHCRRQPMPGSRILVRVCVSNSWRELEADYGEAMLLQMRGQFGGSPEQYRGQQQYMQRRLRDEMVRLATQDEDLLQAVVRLANAQQALGVKTGLRPTKSLQVTPGDDGLPYDAQQMFQVRIGRDAWSHALTQRTFTIAEVTGDIRDVDVQCDQGTTRIEYAAYLDWTLPGGWSRCTLRVEAKRDTTFALYEFDD
jgi:hypothetical protein